MNLYVDDWQERQEAQDEREPDPDAGSYALGLMVICFGTAALLLAGAALLWAIGGPLR